MNTEERYSCVSNYYGTVYVRGDSEGYYIGLGDWEPGRVSEVKINKKFYDIFVEELEGE